jgi:hypothetical protein
MPLVSGVCRTASAPMLSHGGSRLNASKPEANPKTSCPKKQNLFLFFCAFQTFVNENPWRFFFRYWLVLEMSPTRFRASEKAEEQKKERARATIWCERKITSNRIAFQPNAAFRWPRWREVHEKFTSFFLFSQAEALRVRSLFSDSLRRRKKKLFLDTSSQTKLVR